MPATALKPVKVSRDQPDDQRRDDHLDHRVAGFLRSTRATAQDRLARANTLFGLDHRHLESSADQGDSLSAMDR